MWHIVQLARVLAVTDKWLVLDALQCQFVVLVDPVVEIVPAEFAIILKAREVAAKIGGILAVRVL
jgi:hypothetical protein